MTHETALVDGGPAFPHAEQFRGGIVHPPQPGLSLRDWFAGQAIVGMTASPELMVVVSSGPILDGTAFERMAKRAYQLADALLSARAALRKEP